MRTLDNAKGKWQSILINLGMPSSVLSGKHQSCPVCKNGKDTFRFDPESLLGKWYCGYCYGQKLGLDLVKDYFRVDTAEALNMIDKALGMGAKEVKIEKKDPRPRLINIWKRMREPSDDVIKYLDSRGLKPTKAVKQVRQNYYHNGKDYGEFECMACMIHDAEGKAQSIHLTYLKDGKKADLPVDKKVMTPVDTITGGAIRLFEAQRVIGIAEGVETALSCAKMNALPVWATVSANGMENFEVPEGVEVVIIFADNDDNYVGQAAAFNCAKRLRGQGIECYVQIPKNKDFNDDLIEWLNK